MADLPYAHSAELEYLLLVPVLHAIWWVHCGIIWSWNAAYRTIAEACST
jgi:serine acetyltransferase